MNQNLTQYVYRHYQPTEYYRKYLKEQGVRDDGRKINEHRAMRIIIVNIGETTIIASLSYTFQPVTYSPLTNTFGRDLIKINVSPYNASGNPNKFERNAAKQIQQFVINFLFNNQRHRVVKDADKQLVCEIEHQNNTKDHYAFILDVSIVIAGNDGGLAEYSLLAAEILLWCTTFEVPPKFKNQKILNKPSTMLELNKLIFPIRYCQLLDEIVIDPSHSQCLNSNFQVTIMRNMLSKDHNQNSIIIQNSHKGDSPSLYIESLQKLYMTQLTKLAFNIHELKQKIQNGQHNQSLTVKNI